MRNPGDKRVPIAVIREWQSCFRALDGWVIRYKEETKAEHPTGRLFLNGQVVWDCKKKYAEVYPCPAETSLNRYVFHELLHVAVVAAGRSRSRQELLVQDVCMMFDELLVTE